MVELDEGDLLLHAFDMMHGVDVAGGQRSSLVLWFSEGRAACAGREAPWLLESAAAGDDVAQFALASLLEKDLAADGGKEAEVDAMRRVVSLYLQAASQGNPWALSRLGSRRLRHCCRPPDHRARMCYCPLPTALRA